MIFNERFYRTLVVSSSDRFNDAVAPLLYSGRCDPVTYVDSVVVARRALLENRYDFVFINSPLPDDTGYKLAVDCSQDKSTVCLLFIKAEFYGEIKAKVTPHGVFTLQKPVSSSSITQGMEFLASARERLRKLEKKSLSLEEKMEEIRLVNRAKWMLIERTGMTEPDAHRYIEKQAMDRCVTKSDVSKEIISIYS